MTHISGTFKVSAMHEDPFADLGDGRKLSVASGEQSYTGEIDGHGTVRWLMSYRGDGTAHLVGLWQVTGRIGDREGSFVIESIAAFEGKGSTGTLSIVEGMGDGALGGLRGSGTFTAVGGADVGYELDVAFA